ncbi:hypothetical protein AKO1_000302, partial [Acrasis kona]
MSEKKLDKIFCMANKILPRKSLENSTLAKFVGIINFSTVAIPWLRPLIFQLQEELQLSVKEGGWTGYLKLSLEAKRNILKIGNLLKSHNGMPFEMDHQYMIMASDSSKLAYGGVCNGVAM